jgi:putative ABC transport system ATP-binding protein
MDLGVHDDAIVQTRGLGKVVPSGDGSLTILEDIDFSARAGEAVAILGASGSGKSTLLGLMAGLDIPTSGRVWLDGTDITALDEDGRARVRARLLGFVFQSFQLLPAFTALENVMLPLELAGVAEAETRAKEMLGRAVWGHVCTTTPSTFPAVSNRGWPWPGPS